MKLKRIFTALLCLCLLLALLPVSVLGAEIVASGTCGANGDNLMWPLDSAGTLTISGTGEMEDPDSSTGVSWADYKEQVITVILENGVTSIGQYAFSACIGLTNVTIPSIRSTRSIAKTPCG